MTDRLVVGIFAHVDVGKTTLSEAFLYTAGSIRAPGRVDHGDTYLDTDAVERERGITVCAKEARLTVGETEIILVDTPGHVDFSAEAERAMCIPDCAILLISATDGVQPHTRTLWDLLRKNGIPTFLFVNKTDLPHPGEAALAAQIREELCADAFPFFPREAPNARAERMALLSERMLETYTKSGTADSGEVSRLIADGALFPVFFGSARTLDGVRELLDALRELAPRPVYPDRFGALVYRIAYEGNLRMTFLKITGGTLSVRDTVLCDGTAEKVSIIRQYSGVHARPAERVEAGDVCAVAGLSRTRIGQGLGDAASAQPPLIRPVLCYRLILPDGCPEKPFYQKLLLLAQEDPTLCPVWSEELGQIQVQLMGEVQTEVLARRIFDRFGVRVTFGESGILYRETVASAVEGIGHFEPLRHYAEVHLLLEPLPPGSGIVTDTVCPTQMLESHWQNAVLDCLTSARLRGVLTGAPLTDVRITLLSGRAHPKHTDGGDFREATLRAVRQGLMSTQCILLEPYYRYRLSLPAALVGRAIHDLQLRHATFTQSPGTPGTAVLTGRAPVACLAGYTRELAAYSSGAGVLSCLPDGDSPCHNAEEVIGAAGYDPAADTGQPPHSVFCAHGAGFIVSFDRVRDYMHLPPAYRPALPLADARSAVRKVRQSSRADDDELERIMLRACGPIKRRAYRDPHRLTVNGTPTVYTQRPVRLLIDGYNVIFAWDFLSDIAAEDLARARTALTDLLCNYAAFTGADVLLVFDAYRVPMNAGRTEEVDGIRVVYTAEGETADAYLEKYMHLAGPDYTLRLVTSDRLIQFSAVHAGVLRMSAREFLYEIQRIDLEIRARIQKLEKENP